MHNQELVPEKYIFMFFQIFSWTVTVDDFHMSAYIRQAPPQGSEKFPRGKVVNVLTAGVRRVTGAVLCSFFGHKICASDKI